MKITWKLTLVNTFILFLVVSISIWMVYGITSNFLMNAQRRELRRKLGQIVDAVHRYKIEMGMMGMRFYYMSKLLNGLRDIYFALITEDGFEILWDPYNVGELSGKKNEVEKDGRHFIIERFVIPGQGELVVAKDVTALVSSLDRVFRFVITVIVVIGAVSTLLAYTLSAYALKPIKKVVAELRSVSKERLDYRFTPPRSRDEIGELVEEINAMLGRIEEAYRSQERFVANVSHELRTPITTILGHSRMLKRWGNKNPEILEESLDTILETAERMNDLVEALLTTARSEPLETEIVSVLDVANKLVSLHRTKAPDRKIELVVECEPFVKTSPHHLSVILNVLIENAVEHTDSDVEVVLNGEGVSVVDHGHGISEEEREKIFERFYKAPSISHRTRSKGHGIGLSIARELSRALGFEIRVESEVGKGSKFTLLFKDNLTSCEARV